VAWGKLVFGYNGLAGVAAQIDAAGSFYYAGTEVGWRDLPPQLISGNFTLTTDSRGRMVTYTGTGGASFVLPSLAAGSVVSILNNSSNGSNLPLTPGSGVSLYWGTGASINQGARTLTNLALVTLYWATPTSVVIAGSGIA
jgi:hypothetical protein